VAEQICGKCKQPAKWLNWFSPTWAVCNRCQANYIRTTIKAVKRRPTKNKVEDAVDKILQYVIKQNATTRAALKALEDRVILLESQRDITPAKPVSKAGTIRTMLAAEPNLTATEIQRRTGINVDTVKKVKQRLRECAGAGPPPA